MEIIDHNDKLLRIHHLPYVPQKLWLTGTILGTLGVGGIIWGSMGTGRPVFVVIGGLLTLLALWSLLTDERHIMWTFDRESGSLVVHQDTRARETLQQFPLHDVREAVVHTRASHRFEGGHTFRNEVVIRFHSNTPDVSLPIQNDKDDWVEQRKVVHLINTWVYTATADTRDYVLDSPSIENTILESLDNAAKPQTLPSNGKQQRETWDMAVIYGRWMANKPPNVSSDAQKPHHQEGRWMSSNGWQSLDETTPAANVWTKPWVNIRRRWRR